MSARLLPVDEVIQRTGCSRATIYRLEGRGQFPRRRQVTACAVRWLEREIDEWIETRPAVAIGEQPGV